MCGTIDNLFEKPSNLPTALSNMGKGWDPLGSAIFHQDAENIKGVAGNPLASGIATGVAGYFGGPWGAAAAQTALAKERGNDWGTALTQGAVAGGAAYGMGQLGGGEGATNTTGGENAGYTGDSTAAGYDPGYGSSASAADTQAGYTGASSNASTEGTGTFGTNTGSDIPTAQTAAPTTGTETPMDYGMGNADMSQANYPQAGDQSFSLGDWMKSGNFADKLRRYQMLQGGMKTLGGIYDYQAKNKQADELMQKYNQDKAAMDNYYAAGSPEAQAMEEAMARKDAASGRNSQYGTRAVNLAAALAQTRANYRAQMAPGLNNLYKGASDLRASAPSTMFGGLSQMGSGYGLSSMF